MIVPIAILDDPLRVRGFSSLPSIESLASLLSLDVLSTLLQCFILTFSIVQIVNSKQIEDVTRM